MTSVTNVGRVRAGYGDTSGEYCRITECVTTAALYTGQIPEVIEIIYS